MPLPKTQCGVVVLEKGVVDAVPGKELPVLEADSIIVKVKAIAINPTDWKQIDWSLSPGTSVGCDFAGDIVEIGSEAQASGLKVGDAVAGFIRAGYGDSNNGGFQEYIRTLPTLVWKKPQSLPYEAAAPMGGIAMSTAAHALYHGLKFPYPGKSSQVSGTILIWGGSTGVGMYAIRLAKLSGLKIVTTASPRNHDLVKKLGADAVYDYRDAETPKKIKEWSNGTIEYAIDCISEHGSTQLAVSALNPNGAVIVTLLPIEQGDKWPPKVVEKYILLYHALVKDNPDHKEIVEWNKVVPSLIEEGKLDKDAVPLKVWNGGLRGVKDALQYMREGKVSGEKIVLSW